MNILLVHNEYQQRGGEDTVFSAERDLLSSAGHHVAEFRVSNHDISGLSGKLAAAGRVVYSADGRDRLLKAIGETKPDVVHVHNFFPLLSPSVFDACRTANVPSVWTLHNYRVACANGLLLRQDKPCELCIHGSPLWAIRYACYRNSRPATAAVAAMIAYHRAVGTWRHKVSRFIALTEFAKSIATAAGIPAELTDIKPNFVPDPGPPATNGSQRRGAVFVGRLSKEKGLATLLEAWRDIDVPLTIVGDGPEAALAGSVTNSNVTFVGLRDRAAVFDIMRSSRAIIIPSIWYENFPMIVVEAMALGTPVIASRIGALKEIVTDGVNGLLFGPGDAADLARVAAAAFEDPAMLETLGRGARQTYEQRLSPVRNLEILKGIYDKAAAA